MLRIRSQEFDGSERLANAVGHNLYHPQIDNEPENQPNDQEENISENHDSVEDSEDEEIPTEDSHCNPMADKIEQRVALGDKVAIRFNAASR